MQDREGFTSVSFTSVPQRAFEEFKAIAERRKVFPRDVFSEAIRELLDARRAGPVQYLASRKGGIRRAMWLEDDLVEDMRAAAEADNVTQTELFINAMRLYLAKEGIDVEV